MASAKEQLFQEFHEAALKAAASIPWEKHKPPKPRVSIRDTMARRPKKVKRTFVDIDWS